MKEIISFDEWLSVDLSQEVREQNPRYAGFLAMFQVRGTDSPHRSFPIIKRRIAWLIGKWISSSCSSPNNPRLWEILAFLLQDRGPGTDAVVRLTAAIAIRECVDVGRRPLGASLYSADHNRLQTLDFDLAVFIPYIPGIVSQLVRLAAEADTLESKRRIFNSLNAVIERSETQVR